MALTANVGNLSKMLLDGTRFEFLRESLAMRQTHFHSDGIRGSMSRFSNRVQIVSELVSGDISMHCGPTQLDKLWPLALGGTAGSTVTPSDVLTEFNIIVHRGAREMTYANCVVSRMSVAGTEGQPLEVTLGVEGETETVNAAGTAAFGSLDTNNIFIMSHCSLTLQSTGSRKFRNFTLNITNALDTNRLLNSVTREEIPFLGRTVQLTLSMPYTTANADLYDQAVAGAAGELVIASNNILAGVSTTVTYTLTFANCKAPANSPTVPGKSEILLPLTLDCYHDGTDPEIEVVKTVV